MYFNIELGGAGGAAIVLVDVDVDFFEEPGIPPPSRLAGLMTSGLMKTMGVPNW